MKKKTWLQTGVFMFEIIKNFPSNTVLSRRSYLHVSH